MALQPFKKRRFAISIGTRVWVNLNDMDLGPLNTGMFQGCHAIGTIAKYVDKMTYGVLLDHPCFKEMGVIHADYWRIQYLDHVYPYIKSDQVKAHLPVVVMESHESLWWNAYIVSDELDSDNTIVIEWEISYEPHYDQDIVPLERIRLRV